MSKIMGRPMKEIDQKSFEKLCGLQCTLVEICGFFDVDETTMEKWCKKTYGATFSKVFEVKRGAGKISLRRAQFKQAEKNTAMAIFLGKNYLGQRDVIEADFNPECLKKAAELLGEVKSVIE